MVDEHILVPRYGGVTKMLLASSERASFSDRPSVFAGELEKLFAANGFPPR